LWTYVIPHFNQFLGGLQLSPTERTDAESKAERVARSLCKKYYPGDLNPNTYVIVGGHGKRTAVAPHSDLDMLFLLPVEVYTRINGLIGNVQSSLLQEV
jgi:UTP:GlnB (protein PII) uridylyltransferase